MKNKGLNKKPGVALLILLTMLCLSACGNKGDLYLPDEPEEETTSSTETG